VTPGDPEDLKKAVRDFYGKIARSSMPTSCCGTSGCCGDSNPEYSFINEDYSKLPGYVADADLGLGCGIPTESAELQEGETVLDLGSGAGNDAFVARRYVGEKGRVIGVDMTPSMLAKARENAKKLGVTNVEFRLGEIEQMPVDADSVDVVLSNCVLNLVPDKKAAFAEMFRVTRKGGRFCVSDIVTRGTLPDKAREAAVLYAGCVSGAIPKEEYVGGLTEAGFKDVKVRKERVVDVPPEVIEEHLGAEGLKQWKKDGSPILSITVTGVKL